MKRLFCHLLILLPLIATAVGTRRAASAQSPAQSPIATTTPIGEEQSRQRILQLQKLMQHYKPHFAREFEYFADCDIILLTDSTDWQGLIALDGRVLLPPKYIIYRQIVDEQPLPYFLVLREDSLGLMDVVGTRRAASTESPADKEIRWVLPMEYNREFNDCLAGCYAPYLHHWLEDHPSTLHFSLSTHNSPLPTSTSINGPYEYLKPLTEDLFFFSTGNPGDRGDYIFGYVDRYGNTTATPAQLATMEKWLSGVIEYDVDPIIVTDLVPLSTSHSPFSTYLCLSDTHTVGYLLLPKEDSASMALFNRSVSEDPWGNSVGISSKRYVASLVDVQEAETLLVELMKDDILPRFGRYRRYIGNPDNYRKYERFYGFYYNELDERCVYIKMDLDKTPVEFVGFGIMWDACDAVVYLNLDTRQVIRADASSCQSY